MGEQTTGAKREVRRRLAAVVMMDVVGYSRLMGADEVGTLRAMQEQQKDLIVPLVTSYRGRLVSMPGDCMLLEFPSVLDAVSCVLSVQEGVQHRNANVAEDKRIMLRAGVHLGDVIVERRDIFGDGVNIAARLQALAPAGGICVSDDVYRSVRGKIGAEFADLGEQTLKNLPNAVKVHALRRPGEPVAPTPAAREKKAPAMSIVVLPFASFSEDSGDNFFADALTEDITTDLSRISGILVISRSTAFAYKGKAVDAKALARELEVRYVLEGSVQRLGRSLRVNVHLVDGISGGQLWAQRFDHDVSDVSIFQDQVTQLVARELSLELVDAESRGSKRSRPDNHDAVELAMQGWSLLNQAWTRHRDDEARGLFLKSLARDGDHVPALLGLATVLVRNADVGWSLQPEADFQEAERLSNKALALEPKTAAAHRVRSWIFGARNQLAEAIDAAEVAITLNRNDDNAHRLLALWELQAGHAERSRDLIERAIRLSPRDPNIWVSLQILARAEIALGDSELALSHLHKAVRANPEAHFIRLYFATAYGRMKRCDEARQAIADFLQASPGLLDDRPDAVRAVMNAQLELAALGYYLGALDGDDGQHTKRATEQFQRDEGLPPTGCLDEITMARLGHRG